MPADSAAPAPKRPTPLVPFRYRRPAALVATAAVVVALVGGVLVWGSHPGDGGIAAASPSANVPTDSGWQTIGPGGSPGAPGASGAPGTPEATPATGEWHAVAALVPEGSDTATVELDGSFRLTSLDGTPPAELAARVRVDPAVALTVTPEPDGNGVRLTPSEPLAAGTVYRFTLAGPNGETADSWAFQTSAPLHVVSTIPEDHETTVAPNTGIEITFDQDGVTDAASHVTISPKTAGRFEQHGRVLAFIPDALKPGTIYTVTVARGITAGSGGKPMADDLRFQFETDKSGSGVTGTTFEFADPLFESGTSSRPIISMWSSSDEDTAPPKSAQLDIYRLGSLDAAIAGYRQLVAFPAWANWSNEHPIDTGPLTKVLSLDARFADRPKDSGGLLWTALPEPLPAGWYVVEHPSARYPIQAILQVTDIASYLLVTDTKTLLWTNDLATGGPLVAATAAVAGPGTDLGPTDADGVLTVATPASLQPPAEGRTCGLDCVQVISVTKGGRSAFVPASNPSPEGKGGYDGGSGNHWLTFATDRSIYRRTDTVNLWGMIRDRSTGNVPAKVVVRLQAMDEEFIASGAPISTLSLEPGSTGTFSGSIALADVPEGWYELELVVGTDVVRRADFQVSRILKPAYRLEVDTGHRAYVVGERIKATITASFFEGSPVPGVPLRVSQGGDRSVTTDKTGTAIVRTTARLQEPSNRSDREVQSVSVAPRRAEEGQIQGASREFLVFPGSRTITAESRIATGRVRVAGTINTLDRAGLERDLAAGVSPWEVDPRGAPVAGATVTARFIELIPVKKRIGTDYDFIEKRTVPVYEYSTRQRAAGSVRVRTDAKGRFSASVPAGSGHHDYSVILSVADPDGHVIEQETYASDVAAPAYDQSREPMLVSTGVEPTGGYSVGTPVDLTLRDPAHPADKTSRYLFHLTQLGLRDVVVQRSPRYVGAFESWAVPNMLVTGVRFTGSAYTSATYSASFRTQDRRIDVQLSTDKARYSPRDQVTVTVRTTNAVGKPIAAAVVLRAIDEKLFVLGGAQLDEPLIDIYTSLDSGIIASYTSHRGPPLDEYGGGDTTGGGGGDDFRDQFRDSLLFRTVVTGADGRASASFRLSDDLTSWRILGSAFSADVKAGTGSTEVAVGLPFFVDATIAPEYLVTDRPTIIARAFGTALTPAAKVKISVISQSLGLKGAPVTASAFSDVPIRLPALTLGQHSVTIVATYGSGASARTDRLVRTFTVVRSRLATTRTSYVDLTGTVRPDGGTGLTRVVVSDSSAGRYLPLVTDLAAGDGVRLERALAAAAARGLLTDRFGESEGEIPAGNFDGTRYQQEDGGISLVPAGGSDLQVSALAALTGPEEFSKDSLRQYFSDIRSNQASTRERVIYALAGLAGLHATVLPEIQAAAADDGLTIRERLMLGLGAAALGDAKTARTIADSLITGYGEQQAGWARLRVGTTVADGVEGTAMMAILAAATGEPLAPAFWAYVEANPMPDLVVDLHAIGYVERLLERLPPRAASFAYTVGGTRTVVDLKPGETFSMVVTATQLKSLAIERLTGSIGVATDWREPVKASTIERDPDITVTRSVRPSGTVGSGDLVTVDLKVKFGKQAPMGCHLVTELVPSGLVAVGDTESVAYENGEELPAGITIPFDQTGQRVSFCADNQTNDHVAALRYVARVITPGTYTWEPAVVESRTSANHAALTGSGTVTIR